MQITGKIEDGKISIPQNVMDELNLKNGQEVICVIYDNSNALEKRKGGQWRGKVKMADDFDTLPDEILNAFHGEGS